VSLQIHYVDEDEYVLEWREGHKCTTWSVTKADDLVSVLHDILTTVEVNHTPLNPVFLAPAERRAVSGPNPGAEAADKAAREAEMALRNGGAALRVGVGFDGVPVFEDPDSIPPVDWSH
jgi:hypothetical protein